MQIIKDGYIDIKDRISAQGAGAVLNNYNYEIRPKVETWTINGKVLENKTWFPVAGAEVRFSYNDGGQVASVTTDALGNFQIKPLINKNGKLVINAKDFKPYIDSFSARSNGREVYNSNYKMSHSYWTVSGTLVDYKTNDPAVGVSVQCVYDKVAEKTEAVKTDENGYYKITPENDKRGKIVISAEGYITRKEGETSRSADGFEIWNYDIKKEKETYTIVGRVFDDKDKKAIAGAVIEYIAKDGTKISATTDENGDYVIDAPLNQEGNFKVTSNGFKEGKNTIGARSDSKTREVMDFGLDK